MGDCVDGDFGVGMGAEMAREKKPIELRPVDEVPVEDGEVVRLGSDPTRVRVVPEVVVERPRADARLAVAEETLRTHEPGVESLVEAAVVMETQESVWGREREREAPVPWGWFVVLGLVLAGAVVWSLGQVIQGNREVKGEQLQASMYLEDVAALERRLSRSLDVLEQVVRQFCEATSVEEMLPVVRQPERVKPLMEAYYRAHPMVPLGFERQGDFQGTGLGTDTTFWRLRVEVAGGKRMVLIIEQEGEDGYRIDWETAVTYQPMEWDRYVLERPAGTVMDFRVHVMQDVLYSHEYADSGKWRAYRLTTPAGVETLFGYAEKGGEVDRQLMKVLDEQRGRPAAFILRLELPEGLASPRGVTIRKILGSGWIHVEPPDAGA